MYLQKSSLKIRDRANEFKIPSSSSSKSLVSVFDPHYRHYTTSTPIRATATPYKCTLHVLDNRQRQKPRKIIWNAAADSPNVYVHVFTKTFMTCHVSKLPNTSNSANVVDEKNSVSSESSQLSQHIENIFRYISQKREKRTHTHTLEHTGDRNIAHRLQLEFTW